MAEVNKIDPIWILPNGEPGNPIGFNPDNLTGPIEAVRAAVGTIEELLVIARQVNTLLISVEDPLTAAMATLSSLLSALIDSLLETGAFFYPLLPPPKWESLLRPFSTSSATAALVRSLSDEMDSERPQANVHSGYAGVLLLAGANQWHDFTILLRLLQSISKESGKWGKLASQWDAFKYKKIPQRAHRNTAGTTWDWSSWRLEEIEEVEKALLGLRGMLLGLDVGITSNLTEMIRMVSKRLDFYLRILQQAAALVDFIARLADFKARCYVLPLASQSGGVDSFARDVNLAENKPEFELCCGIALVGFGTDLTFFNAFKAVTAFIGVTEAEWGNAGMAFEEALEP